MASPSQYRRNGRLAFKPDSRPEDHYKKYGKSTMGSPAFKQFCAGWEEAKFAHTNSQTTESLDFCTGCEVVLLEDEKEHTLGDVCYKCCENQHIENYKLCENARCPFWECSVVHVGTFPEIGDNHLTIKGENNMIGKTYEISEENQKILNCIHDNMATHKVGMNHHATRLREEGQSLWDTIVELIPEIDTQKYVYMYDQSIGKVVCSGVRPKDDFGF